VVVFFSSGRRCSKLIESAPLLISSFFGKKEEGEILFHIFGKKEEGETSLPHFRECTSAYSSPKRGDSFSPAHGFCRLSLSVLRNWNKQHHSSLDSFHLVDNFFGKKKLWIFANPEEKLLYCSIILKT